MSPTATTASTDQTSLQHSLDPELKITLGNLSPGRLSPNLFLGINLDHIGVDRNTLALEWSSFTPSTSGGGPMSQSSSNNCLNLDDTAPASPFDECKYLNVDQFNMENFKTECILNLDQSMLDDPKRMLEHQDHEQQYQLTTHHTMDLDLQDYSLHDTSNEYKSTSLTELDKPIMNITIRENVSNNDKY